MAARVIWHGSTAEAQMLIAALAANCACHYGLMGVRLDTCAAHIAFTTDQRFLDGLLFARRLLRERLLTEEHGDYEWSPQGAEWLLPPLEST